MRVDMYISAPVAGVVDEAMDRWPIFSARRDDSTWLQLLYGLGFGRKINYDKYEFFFVQHQHVPGSPPLFVLYGVKRGKKKDGATTADVDYFLSCETKRIAAVNVTSDILQGLQRSEYFRLNLDKWAQISVNVILSSYNLRPNEMAKDVSTVILENADEKVTEIMVQRLAHKFWEDKDGMFDYKAEFDKNAEYKRMYEDILDAKSLSKGLKNRLSDMMEVRSKEDEAKIARLEKEIGDKNSEITRLNGIATTLDAGAELLKLSNEFEAKKRELEEKVEEINRLTGEVETKNEELAAKQNEIKTLRGEVEAKDTQLANKVKETTRLSGEVETKNEELAAKQNEIKTLRGEVEAKDTQLANKVKETTRLSGEVETKNEELAANQNEMTALRGKVEAKKAELTSNAIKITNLEQETEAQKITLQARDSTINELNGKLEEEKAKIATAERATADAETAKTAAVNALDVLRSTSTADADKENIVKLTNENNTLKGKLASETERADKMQEERLTFAGENDKYKEAIRKLQNQIKALEGMKQRNTFNSTEAGSVITSANIGTPTTPTTLPATTTANADTPPPPSTPPDTQDTTANGAAGTTTSSPTKEEKVAALVDTCTDNIALATNETESTENYKTHNNTIISQLASIIQMEPSNATATFTEINNALGTIPSSKDNLKRQQADQELGSDQDAVKSMQYSQLAATIYFQLYRLKQNGTITGDRLDQLMVSETPPTSNLTSYLLMEDNNELNPELYNAKIENMRLLCRFLNEFGFKNIGLFVRVSNMLKAIRTNTEVAEIIKHLFVVDFASMTDSELAQYIARKQIEAPPAMPSSSTKAAPRCVLASNALYVPAPAYNTACAYDAVEPKYMPLIPANAHFATGNMY